MSLFLDTSSEYIILILFSNNKVIDTFYNYAWKKHNECALENINTFLSKNNLFPKDIDKIYCINGPGSFTGTRVALTIVKAWKIIFPKILIYIADSFVIQANSVEYVSANTYDVYDRSFNVLKRNNIDENKIGYKDYKNICDKFLNNVSKFVEIKSLDELNPLYIKGFM